MKTTIFIILFSLVVSAQAYAWVIKPDFDGGTQGMRANGATGFTSYAGTDCTYDNSEKHSGNQSVRCRLPIGSYGQTSKWNLEQALPTHLPVGSELWFRTWVKVPANFRWAPERNGTKFMRVWTRKADGSNKRYINVYNKSTHVLTENWTPGVDVFYKNNGGVGSSIVRSNPRLGYNLSGKYVGWEAIEMYVRFGIAGQGIVRVWRNGTLWFEDKQTATAQNSGGYSDTVSLFGHYSNTSNESPSPQDQSIWVDDVIITNERPSNTDSRGNPYIGVGDVKIIADPEPPTVH